MNKLIFAVIIATLFLSSCGEIGKEIVTKTDVVRVYPEMPPLKPLPPLNLQPFSWDYPRDITKKIPKSTKKCLDVPDDKRVGNYWDRCGIHPPLYDSNIYMGLTQMDYGTLQINFGKLKTRILQYEFRIKEVNKQRLEWIRKNKEIKKGEE